MHTGALLLTAPEIKADHTRITASKEDLAVLTARTFPLPETVNSITAAAFS